MPQWRVPLAQQLVQALAIWLTGTRYGDASMTVCQSVLNRTHSVVSAMKDTGPNQDITVLYRARRVRWATRARRGR
jgi:hypothetical protein